LFEERHNPSHPAPIGSEAFVLSGVEGRQAIVAGRRESSVDIMIVVQGQPELLHVVETPDPIASLANSLHRRQQQSDQDADNGDHDQQLDERKASGDKGTAYCVRGSLYLAGGS